MQHHHDHDHDHDHPLEDVLLANKLYKGPRCTLTIKAPLQDSRSCYFSLSRRQQVPRVPRTWLTGSSSNLPHLSPYRCHTSPGRTGSRSKTRVASSGVLGGRQEKGVAVGQDHILARREGTAATPPRRRWCARISGSVVEQKLGWIGGLLLCYCAQCGDNASSIIIWDPRYHVQ